jgi:hypothetical protein
MSFELLDSQGDPFGSRGSMYVYLYPNKSWATDEEKARNEVADALSTFGRQLYNSAVIDYWEINLYEGHTDCEYEYGEDDGSTYKTNFYNWIDSNYGSRRGIHLGVTHHTSFANAESMSPGDSAFQACTKAFVGTKGDYDVTEEDKQRWMNLAVQEPAHNMIVDDYHDKDAGDEHDLGEIKSSGSSTPMLTFYEREDTHPTRDHDRSGKGECSEDGTWDGTHIRTVTTCTEDAIQATAEEEA